MCRVLLKIINFTRLDIGCVPFHGTCPRVFVSLFLFVVNTKSGTMCVISVSIRNYDVLEATDSQSYMHAKN